MKAGMVLVCGLGLLLSVAVRAGELNLPFTTRERTVCPCPWNPNPAVDCPSNVNAYLTKYGLWKYGTGEVAQCRFDLLPGGNTNVEIKARLSSFFSISDIHITDKESPAQVPYLGWSAKLLDPGPGSLNPNAYSPIILSTTHVLDAAVRTINMLHTNGASFDFGLALGDFCNSSQWNELRWFIDVMDGCWIEPSSGAHDGTNSIDYQMGYQAAGLNTNIPWYAVLGNHDQYLVGVDYPTKYIFTSQYVRKIQMLSGNATTDIYAGVVNGNTSNGVIIKGGPLNLFPQPPTVFPDPNRHTLTSDVSAPRAFVAEFTNSATRPKGHGFKLNNLSCLTACYTFNPLADLKVIVLDDTCKTMTTAPKYGGGWMDAARTRWLTNELQLGQKSNQLMILACHIPVRPQADLNDTTILTNAMFVETNQEANLLATLHNYPNLILLMAGHRHKNVVTPQPSPRTGHPEYGFWEVETPSLRDFPQQFRTWEICLNSDTNISIVTTDVDPVITDTNSPAGKSRSYAIGAAHVFGIISTNDTQPHICNAELIKPLSGEMKAKLGAYLTNTNYRVWPVKVSFQWTGHPDNRATGIEGGAGYYKAGAAVNIFAQPGPGSSLYEWLDQKVPYPSNFIRRITVAAKTNEYTAVFINNW